MVLFHHIFVSIPSHLCLSQAGTCISYAMVFCVQWFEMRSDLVLLKLVELLTITV